MQNVAQSWLVYQLTGSAVLLGLVGFASQIPVFLLASIGGTIADRYHRHRILIVTQISAMILASILTLLTLTNQIQVGHIFVLASLLGVVNAFDIPTRQAFVVDMVGRDDLVNAVALNSSMFNGARMIGPAVAGVMVAGFGEGWCFFVNAVSYLAVIAGLLLMRVKEVKRPTVSESALAHVAEGFRYIRNAIPVRSLLLMLGLVSLTGMPYAVLMPIFADQILHGGPSGLGILMGASGFGAFLGAAVLTMRKGIRGLGRWVGYSATGFGMSLILFSFSRTFLLSAFLLVPVGFFMIIQLASSNTLIQSMVPDRLRGRVMAVYSMMFMGMAPLGALMAGMLAHRMGAPITVALGGGVCIVGAAAFLVHLPAFRYEAHQLIVALQASGGTPAEEVTGTVVASKK